MGQNNYELIRDDFERVQKASRYATQVRDNLNQIIRICDEANQIDTMTGNKSHPPMSELREAIELLVGQINKKLHNLSEAKLTKKTTSLDDFDRESVVYHVEKLGKTVRILDPIWEGKPPISEQEAINTVEAAYRRDLRKGIPWK